MIITNLGKALVVKDGIVIEIVFKFQEVVGRVLEKKSQVFERCAREAALRLTKKG